MGYFPHFPLAIFSIFAIVASVIGINKASNAEKSADPFRKRTFDPRRDVALMMVAWEEANPGIKFGWHMNKALEEYLTKKGYASQLSKLSKLYPED